MPRTRRDPHADTDVPRTFVNTETHWWDASQIYGSTQEFQDAVRRPKLGKGKVAIGADDLIDIDPSLLGSSGGLDGWWVGLELLHTLFMREHNAVCDMLAATYPDWSDDEVFDKARLIIAALIAKIHTVEWTTAILNRPALRIGMRANWFGLAGEQVRTLYGRLTDSEIAQRHPRIAHRPPLRPVLDHRGVRRGLPHAPAHPRRAAAALRGRPADQHTAAVHGRRPAAQPAAAEQHGATDLLYSLGTANPGAVTLHNHPRFMQHLVRTEDEASPRPRRRGPAPLPRARGPALQRVPPPDAPAGGHVVRAAHRRPATADELRAVYPTVDDVDLTVGLYAEKPPAGFGFCDTTFRIFILMASRRLKSDRFFTTDFTPRVYTPEGMAWIEDNDMCSVLLRHHPRLAPALRGVQNAFAPWTVPGQEAQQ